MHERAIVICPTDKRLYAREGTTRTEVRVKSSEIFVDPSPITGEGEPLAVETTC